MYLFFSSLLLLLSVFIYYKSQAKEARIKKYEESIDKNINNLNLLKEKIEKRSEETCKLTSHVNNIEKNQSNKIIQELQYNVFCSTETMKWIYLNFLLDVGLLTNHSDIYNVIFFRLKDLEPDFIDNIAIIFENGDIEKIKSIINEVSNSMILLAPNEQEGAFGPN